MTPMNIKDCLLIGFNDSDFPEFVEMMRGMGEGTGSYRDLNLAFVEIDGKPYRCLDLINRFYDEEGISGDTPYENSEFIWPVVLYLGSYLAKRNFSFDYINLFHREKWRLLDELRNTQYRSVVITTTVYVSPHPILEIIEFLRENGIQAPIIVGGPYISSQHRVMSQEELSTLFSFLGGDIYIISAEGEATLAKVLERLRDGNGLDGVPNLALRGDSDEFVFHPIEVEKNELSDELVDYNLFGAAKIGEFVSLRTAKSCPFACNFCGFPQRAGKYTYTSLEVVAKELDAIAELGTVSTLTFLDDTFNVPKGRFKDILRLMIDREYGFHWNSFYRSDHGDEETIELMARAGCEGVFLGVESGSDYMLGLMNKTARKADYAFAINKFRDVGIATYASLIIGFPGETQETAAETYEFIEMNRPTVYRAQLFYLDPATPVWRDREKLQISGGGFEWQHPTMNNHEATDIIERMFCDIKNSTWAPQHGFEDWSLYYLKRRGFSLDEVIRFVDYFNSLIRLKFVPSHSVTSQERILEEMKSLAVSARRRYLSTPKQMTRSKIISPQYREIHRQSRVIPISHIETTN